MKVRSLLKILMFLSLTQCMTRHKNPFSDVKDMFLYEFDKGKDPNIPAKKYDPTLAPYVTEFLKDAKSRGVTITDMAVNELKTFLYTSALSSPADGGVMAACTRYYAYKTTPSGQIKVRWTIIEVLKDATHNFTEGSPERLKELLYHELFHCLMNKGHLPKGIPGIMAPELIKNDIRVFNDWNGLVDEMFSPVYLKMIPDAT